MKAAAKPPVARDAGGAWVPKSVSFGAVTVQVEAPPENVLQANIEAGQAALRRGKAALMKTGVKLTRGKGIPLYFGCDDRPGWMVRDLDGKKTVGRFVGGRFISEKPAISSKKRIPTT
jgi:hypothetical protein